MSILPTAHKLCWDYFAIQTVPSFVQIWLCGTSSKANLVEWEVSIPTMWVVISWALIIVALDLLVEMTFLMEVILCTF